MFIVNEVNNKLRANGVNQQFKAAKQSIEV